MSRDVPSESKSIGTNSKYSSLARMFTWTFMICPFHMFSHSSRIMFTFLWDMPFPYIWWLFQKWLPRPNHSAHMKGIEILCKTAVSMSRDVSSESKSIGTNSKYSSLAWMSTWISRWRRRRRRRPNNSAHLVRPLGYRVQEPNIPCGESLTSIFGMYFWNGLKLIANFGKELIFILYLT